MKIVGYLVMLTIDVIIFMMTLRDLLNILGEDKNE